MSAGACLGQRPLTKKIASAREVKHHGWVVCPSEVSFEMGVYRMGERIYNKKVNPTYVRLADKREAKSPLAVT